MLKSALLIAALAPLIAASQDFDTHILDKYESQASDSVNVNLSGIHLRLAAKFLSNDDADERRVKQILSSVKGIHVKTLEFDREGVISEQDLRAIRSQLKGPEWVRLVGAHRRRDGESADVFMRIGGKEPQLRGVAVIAAGPRDLTIVRIDGTLDPADLRDLGGHFSVPEIDMGEGAGR